MGAQPWQPDASDVAVVIPHIDVPGHGSDTSSSSVQNRWEVLGRTIAGLRAQSVNGSEIVVVVDEAAELPEFLNGIQVVYRNRRGVSAARNDGVKATDRRLIMFLGNDTIPEPELIERHLAVHRLHPADEVGVLGTVSWHPEVARGRLQRWLNWSGTQFDYHTIVGDEAGWGRLYSSNVSLKRALFDKVGGFDEELVFGYEDIELGLRLGGAGLRLLYEPRANVWHVHPYNLAAIERRFRLVGGGEYLMVRKHPEFPPFFLDKFRRGGRVAPFSPWPWLVDFVPARAGRVRRVAEKRADAWYSKRLAAPFVAGWLAAEELEEEQTAVDHYPQVASERLAEQRWLGDILKLLSPGRAMLVAGCSPTITRELAAAGYPLTSVVANDDVAERVRRRFEARDLEAEFVVVESLDPSSTFAAALAFRIDRVESARALLDAAERQSSVIAASFESESPIARDVLERAKRAGIVLQLHDDDGTSLVIFRGHQPLERVDQSLLRRLREAGARYTARRLGRRRPWVPYPSGAARNANWSCPMSTNR